MSRKQKTTEKSALLLDTVNPTDTLAIADNERHYTGHYAKYDVPYYFQQLVSSIKKLRDLLDNEKYWLNFYIIKTSLLAYHNSLETNNFLGKERLSSLSGSIQLQLNMIVSLKKTIKKQIELVTLVAEILEHLKDLTKKFDFAENNKQELPKKTALVNTFSIQIIDGWIEDIGKENKKESCVRIFAHTFYYQKKTSLTAFAFFTMAIGAAMQTSMEYGLTKMKYIPDEDVSFNLHLGLRFGLPTVLVVFGLILSIYALVKTSQARKERRDQQQQHARQFSHLFSSINSDEKSDQHDGLRTYQDPEAVIVI